MTLQIRLIQLGIPKARDEGSGSGGVQRRAPKQEPQPGPLEGSTLRARKGLLRHRQEGSGRKELEKVYSEDAHLRDVADLLSNDAEA